MVLKVIYALPVFGSVARVALWEIFCRAPDGTRGWSVFWQIDNSDIIFRETDKRIVYAVLRLIAVSSQSQADTWSRQVRRHVVMGAGGMNGCQGTPWSKELDGKEIHRVPGGDLEPRESAVSCTSSTRR